MKIAHKIKIGDNFNTFTFKTIIKTLQNLNRKKYRIPCLNWYYWCLISIIWEFFDTFLTNCYFKHKFFISIYNNYFTPVTRYVDTFLVMANDDDDTTTTYSTTNLIIYLYLFITTPLLHGTWKEEQWKHFSNSVELLILFVHKMSIKLAFRNKNIPLCLH